MGHCKEICILYNSQVLGYLAVGRLFLSNAPYDNYDCNKRTWKLKYGHGPKKGASTPKCLWLNNTTYTATDILSQSY
jgi:hypothetical protein